MKILKVIVAVVTVSLWLGACSQAEDCTSPEWFRGSAVVSEDGSVNMDSLDNDKIDLIYLVSTEVLSAKDSANAVVYQSTLSADDRKTIDAELAFAERNFSKGDFNFLAPYYHQYTFEAVTLPDSAFQTVYDKVKDEVNGIIDYYLTHINNGRKFAIVGFSQGAMLTVDVLKHCRKEALQNMVGAYLIGYGINDEDINCENITPATGEDGFGHTISFNSVMTGDATWSFVYNNATAAINPVNWTIDATPATIEFEGQTITVTLDQNLHELIADIPDKTPFYDFMNSNPAYKMADVHQGCLHRWDLLFYTQQIHDNIIKRAKLTAK